MARNGPRSCARSPSCISAKADELAEIEARDGGGTIKKAMFADVPGAQGAFQWFAAWPRSSPTRSTCRARPFPPSKNYIRYEPYGVCTGIVPWNFPLIMAAWKIAPRSPPATPR